MSRTGNCYDNAAMESFWSTLKTELVYHETFATREMARQAIFEYVEVFHNRERRHSSIGYISPESLEAALNSRASAVRGEGQGCVDLQHLAQYGQPATA